MKSRARYEIPAVIAIFLFAVTVLFFCLFETETEPTRITGTGNVYELPLKSTNNPSFSVPIPEPLNGHESTVTSYRIPSINCTNPSIMFKSGYYAARVYLDGELLGSYGTINQLPFGHMSGNIRVILPLGGDASGKELSIVLSPYYDLGNGVVTVWFGASDDIKMQIVHDNIWRLVLAVFLCFVAIMCFGLCIYQFITRTIHVNLVSYLYLGWFVVNVLFWIISSSDIPQFYTDANGAVALWSYMSLAVMGIPFTGFCAETFTKHKRYFRSIQLIGCIVPAVVIIAFIADIVDPTESVFLAHIYILLVIIMSIVFSIREWKSNKDSRMFIVGLGILIIAAFLGLGWYYFEPEKGYDALFFGIGFLFFIMILFAIMLAREARFIRERMSTDIYKEMAFIDKLTGCGNRASLEADALDGSVYGDKPLITFGIFDLNYLKKTNDTEGHAAGDRLIMAAANCLTNALGKMGKAYRLGGDEFAVVMWNEIGKTDVFLKNLEYEIKSYNANHEIKVSLASGLVERKWEPGEKFFMKLYHDADELMYEDKEKYHRNN